MSRVPMPKQPALWGLGLLVLILGVASVAGPLAGRRRLEYRARAESFAMGEAALLEQIAETLKAAREAEQKHSDPARAETLRAEAERLARVGAWHVRLEQKYAWAADHPWSPLPPDPAPPE